MEQLMIQHEASGNLVGVQTSPGIAGPMSIPVVLVLVGLGFCLVTRRWLPFLGLAVVLCVFGLATRFARPGPTYRTFVDASSRSIAWSTHQGDMEKSADSISIDQIQTANVETHQNGSRVFLLKRNGEVVYPLGTEFRMGEPEQFAISDAIRAMLPSQAVAH